MSFKENIDDNDKYIQLSEEKFVYFIVEHGLFLKSTKTDIKGTISNLGSVVFKCNIKDKIFPMPKGFEGPFYSIEMLRTYSKIYKDLKVSNPKRAKNIFNDNAIQLYRGYGKIKKGHTFSIDEAESIVHAIFGTFKKDIVTGIHFFDKKTMKIIEKIKVSNNGVFSARVSIYNIYSSSWVEKDGFSTFFPLSWTIDDLVYILYNAFNNKEKTPGTLNKFQYRTNTGVLIEFIMHEGEIKTFYPILE